MAEWLKRQTHNLLPFGDTGSNPVACKKGNTILLARVGILSFFKDDFFVYKFNCVALLPSLSLPTDLYSVQVQIIDLITSGIQIEDL